MTYGSYMLCVKLLRLYLCVKRISLQLVDTLELMGVALGHDQAVLLPLEHLSLIQHLKPTPCEIPLPFNPYICAPFVDPPQPAAFLLVSVGVDDQGQPDTLDFIFRESIEVGVDFEVVVPCSVLLPLKSDLELEFYGVIFFMDCNNLV